MAVLHAQDDRRPGEWLAAAAIVGPENLRKHEIAAAIERARAARSEGTELDRAAHSASAEISPDRRLQAAPCRTPARGKDPGYRRPGPLKFKVAKSEGFRGFAARIRDREIKDVAA